MSLQLDTVLCDLFLGIHEQNGTNDINITLSWEIHGVIEVLNRDTGEGFLTGASL